jgi:hypothetical protein
MHGYLIESLDFSDLKQKIVEILKRNDRGVNKAVEASDCPILA